MDRGIVDSRQSNVHRSFCRIRFKLGLYAERVFSVVVSFGIIPLNQLRKTRQEVGIVFLFRAGPLNFTQCSPTRQYHVLRVRESSDVFCPEVGLHTLDIFLFFRSQRSRHRFVAVHSFQRQVTTDTKWFVIYVFSLVIVEIQVCVRCHNDIVFLFRSFDTALFTTPWHNSCVRSKSAFEDFIPTDDLTSVVVEEFFDMVDYEALQTFFLAMLIIRFQAQRLDTCLTFRTFFPTYFRTFVTTYMNIFWREDFNQFSIYVFEEFQYLIVSGTKHIFRYSPLSPYFVRATGTSQFGISGKGSLHVSRKIDFGNNCDITFGSISYYFFRLLLGIEATVRFAVVFTGVTSDDCFCSLGTYFCQLRIFLDFQTPTLVFGNMPVKTIHIV